MLISPDDPGAGNLQRRVPFKSWYVVVLLAAICLIGQIDRLALGLLVDPIRSDLMVSDVQVGLLIGPTFAILMTVFAFPAAFWVDRGNRKWLLVGGVTLWSLTTVASAFATTFGWLLMSRMGVGIGEAVLWPVALSMIGDLFERERRPTPTGIFISAGTLGGGLCFVVVAALLQFSQSHAHFLPSVLEGMAQWRLVLLGIGLPGLVLALLLAATISEPCRGQFERKIVVPGRAHVNAPNPFPGKWAAARFWLPYLIGTNIMAMNAYITVSWFPTFLIREHGMDTSRTGYLFGTFTLVGGVMGVLGLPILSEYLAKRGRKDSILPIALISMPFALLAFLVSATTASVVLAIVAVATFKAFNNGVSATGSVVIASIGTPATRGRLSAVHLTIQSVLALSFGPVIIPVIASKFFDGRLGPAMTLVAGVSIPIAFLLILSAWKPYKVAVNR
jgi:MFS family permease